jgi:sugar phosphate isomerase/epimerase
MERGPPKGGAGLDWSKAWELEYVLVGHFPKRSGEKGTTMQSLTRRGWLQSAAGLAAGLTLGETPSARADKGKDSFRYCLNTSTLQGQKLDLIELIEITAKAGYEAIEPWARELDQYVKDGGDLKDGAARIKDRGLRVDDVIAFFDWAVDDEGRRRKGLEEAKRVMDRTRQLGGQRIAAPPAGATDQADLNLFKVAERYRALLELGDKMEVVPQVEFWGFSRPLSRLSEAALVAVESGHAKACILADVYHANALQVVHFNDYPADPPRNSITDAARVYPGAGVAPLKQIVRTLRDIGFKGVLSLELFNRDYWKQDAKEVAKTGLEKMKNVVRESLE